MTRNIEVVRLGALNIDHLYRVERILEDGESVVNETLSSLGGSATNPIYGLARLGGAIGFCGIVGDDAEGRIFIEDFEKASVDTTGAGDAFATGFLYDLLKGKGLRECGWPGDTAARCSISRAGARKSLPMAEELGQHYHRLCS